MFPVIPLLSWTPAKNVETYDTWKNQRTNRWSYLEVQKNSSTFVFDTVSLIFFREHCVKFFPLKIEFCQQKHIYKKSRPYMFKYLTPNYCLGRKLQGFWVDMNVLAKILTWEKLRKKIIEMKNLQKYYICVRRKFAVKKNLKL